jgi:uncharacterized protein YqiB (DUF1249 family)
MLRTVRQRRHPLPSRFAYLMGMYTENYWRLTRVFGPERLELGRFLSAVGDGLDLTLEVLELHPYTIDLRLSYLFRDEHSGRPDPSAHVRLYRDARMAEVTTCYVGSRLEDVLGRFPDPKVAVDHRLRMSSFLGKWLEYLELRGHSRFTLNPT